MEKRDKKILILTGVGLAVTTATSFYLFGKNRKLNGIIRNQRITIEGLTKELEKLAYHLGKKN